MAAITNSCLTAWLKTQPQPQSQPQPHRQSCSLNLKPKPKPSPNLDAAAAPAAAGVVSAVSDVGVCGLQIKARTSVATATSRMMKRLTKLRMRCWGPPLHSMTRTRPENEQPHPHPHPCRSMVSGVIALPFELAIYTAFFFCRSTSAPVPAPAAAPAPAWLLVMETCPHIYLCGSHFCVASLAMLNWFIIFQRCILTFPVANMRPVCLCILHLHFAFAASLFCPPLCPNKLISPFSPYLDTSGHRHNDVSYSAAFMNCQRF